MDDFINQFSTVLSAFDAGTLIGLIALTNLLTNLTKVPRVRVWLPADARKWVALGLGLAGGVLAALASGKPWMASLLQGVIIGVGAIGTHEVTSPAVDKLRKAGPEVNSVVMAFLICGGMALVVTQSTGCAWWAKNKSDIKDRGAECAKPEVKNVISAALPIALALVDKLMDGDGAVDWDAFADKTKASGWDGAVCLYQQAVDKFLVARAKAAPNSTPTMDPDLQRERALEAKARVWPGQ